MALRGAGIAKISSAIGLLGGLANDGSLEPRGEQEMFDSVRAGVRANIRKYGIQKPSFAFANFAMPKIFQPTIVDYEDDMGDVQMDTPLDEREIALLCRFRTESFSQPGLQFSYSDIKRYGVGVIEKKPVVPIFIDLPFRYINDSDGVLRKFFAYWMKGIVNYSDLPSHGAKADAFGKLPMEVEYKDNYSTTIEVYQFNEVNEKVMVVKLYNAYPIAISDIGNSWAQQDSFTEFDVTYTYSHWSIDEIDKIELRNPKTQVNNDFSFLKSVVTATTFASALSTMKSPSSFGDVLNIVNTGATMVRSSTGAVLDY